jgi:hypothetical protein
LLDKLTNPYVVEIADGFEVKIETILRNYNTKIDDQGIPLEANTHAIRRFRHSLRNELVVKE